MESSEAPNQFGVGNHAARKIRQGLRPLQARKNFPHYGRRDEKIDELPTIPVRGERIVHFARSDTTDDARRG